VNCVISGVQVVWQARGRVGRVAAALAMGFLSSIAQADLYWDTDGAVPGGNSNFATDGTWGIDPFWSISADGDVATAGWIAGEHAIFSAGSDVLGNRHVMVNGIQSIRKLTVEEGTISLGSGTIDFGGVEAVIMTTGNATVFSTLTGVTALTKEGPGLLILGALNNSTLATAPIAVNAGSLQVASGFTSGPLTVRGRIIGTGLIAAKVTALPGARIAPGNNVSNVSTISMHGLTLDGAHLDMQGTVVNQRTTFDQIRVQLADQFKLLGDSTINISEINGTIGVGEYPIIDYSGTPLANINGLRLSSPRFREFRTSLVHDVTFTQVRLRLDIFDISRWNIDRDGSWGVVSNWSTTYEPNAATDDVYFTRNATARRTITLDGDKTVGRMYLENFSDGYIIAAGSGGTLMVAGAVAVLRGVNVISAPLTMIDDSRLAAVARSQLRIDGAFSIAAGKTVSASGEHDYEFGEYSALLLISGPQSHGVGAKLQVKEKVYLNSDAGAPPTAATPAQANLALELITIDEDWIMGSSNLVLGSHQHLKELKIPLSNREHQWVGLDLASPAAAGAYHGVYIYAADLEATKVAMWRAIRNSFSKPDDGIFDSGLHEGAAVGVAIVTDAYGDRNVTVRSTRIGDLNLDGAVTVADFMQLAANFNAIGSATWQEGDVNYDQSVTIADFMMLAAHFNSTYGGEILGQDAHILASFAASMGVDPSVIGSAVPEPAGVSALAIGAMGLSRRRRT
jgi:hypothetical protein